MKKEKNFSEKDFSEKIEPSDKKALESLSDDEILQGFKDANARIVREYYYGYAGWLIASTTSDMTCSTSQAWISSRWLTNTISISANTTSSLWKIESQACRSKHGW